MLVTPEQRGLWERLPEEFGVQEMIKQGTSRKLLYTVIDKAGTARLLVQHPETKRYHKVKVGGPE